jgi:hypothetical protein
MGLKEWRGHVAFGSAYTLLVAEPTDALQLNIDAFYAYPWDWEIRQQVYLSLRNLTMKRNVVMDEASEQWAWNVSASASPWSPLLHASKIEVPK